jgi:gliding motility-associated-like protein
MKKPVIFLFILFFLVYLESFGQDYSNKGTDFWLGYGYHVNMAGNQASGGTQDMVLYYTSDKNATVTVDIPGVTGFAPLTYQVLANQVTTSAPMPKSGTTDARINVAGLSNKGIHITSDVPIVAYAHIYNSAISGASLLFPTATLGKDYYSVNFTQSSNAANANSFFFVVATEDGTSVEITPSAANLNGLTPNTPTIIPLNKGQVYNVMGTTSANQGTDLTGSRIRSISTNSTGGCKKIAVFSGAGKISIGGGAGGSADNLFAQSFPAVAWGKKYLTAPTGSQPNNYYRICVTDPNTNVALNGVLLPKSSLINGFYYQFLNGNATGTNPATPNLIESDIPILVAQYCTTEGMDGNTPSPYGGDPEMIYLSPVEQTINSITLYSASQFKILQSYINIIIKNQGVTSFTLDGVSKSTFFQTHPKEPNYSYAIIPVSSGSHTLYADSGFNAIAYGFGNAESYGYNAGTNVRDFSQTAVFQNTYKRIDSAVSCVNSPFQFSIPLNFVPSTIKWDFSAAPNILPNSTLTPAVAYDSFPSVNNQTVYYFSPQQSFKFSKSNTAAQRDTIKLYTTSTTPDGCGSTAQLYAIPVKVVDLPIANFTTNNAGCVSDSVHFFDATNTSGQFIVESAIWNFGDNTSSNELSPVKKFGSSGTYNIRYRPINNYGCAGDTVIVKTYTDTPIALFNISDSCKNQTIKLTDLSTVASGSTITKWFWDYGNGIKDTLSTNQLRSVTYTDTGIVTISLTVETNGGCRSVAFNKQVHIRPLPEPGFILPEVCQNDAVTQFKDSTKIADGSNSFTYLWNFNAGTPAIIPAPVPITTADLTAKDPKVKYTTHGYYAVSLKVTSIYGCAVTIAQPFTVNGSNPNPDFEVLNQSALCSNQLVSIRNKSAMLDFGDVTRIDIYWDTNDLSKKTSIETPHYDSIYSYDYHSFQTPATKNYTIRLVAFSGDAGSSCNKIIEKRIVVNQSPKVSFSVIPSICLDANPRIITQANFVNTVPNALGSPVYSGNGITNAATGLFDPTVTGVGSAFPIQYLSISDKGCRDSLTQSIKVWPSPIAKWSNSAILCEKNNILFSDSSLANYGTIEKRIWDFGNNTVIDKKTDTVFSYLYTTASTYPVSLKVITDSGCVSTINTKTLTVHYLPRVQFSLPAVVCLPNGNASFINSSSISDGTESMFSYSWSFGDPLNSANWILKDGQHCYSKLGTYPVFLKVTSNDGCIDSAVQQFANIFPQPKAAFKNNIDTICINNQIQFTDLSNGLSSAVASWKWDFGNGTSSIVQNPNINFSDSGSFTVSLTIYNAQGCVSDTSTKIVSVQPYPVVELGATRMVLEKGQVAIKPAWVFGNALQYLWTPATYLNSDTASVPISAPLADITYTLSLTGLGNCTVTDNVLIKVLLAPVVPNAFSPNGDGINDTWKIQYLESYPGATIDIFNRYGQKVFASVGYNTEWDGNFNGSPLPIGTYYYIINPKNGRAAINGSVTIIK